MVPPLAIVIVSFNTRDITLRCLDTLRGDPATAQALTFVVDNGSSDGSADAIARDFPGVRLIRNDRNVGFGAANNQALRLVDSEWALLLNSDAFPLPGSIAELLRYGAAHPGVGVVGPRLLKTDGSTQSSCYRFPTPARAMCEAVGLTSLFPDSPRLGDYRNWDYRANGSPEFVMGACMLVRRSALDVAGIFDEAFFLYAEETDLSRRIRMAGFNIAFVPAAEVTHIGSGSGGKQPDRVYTERQRGSERFIRKYHGAVGLGIYRVAICLGSAVRIVAYSLLARLRPSMQPGLEKKLASWRRGLIWTLGRRGPGLSELLSAPP